MRVNGTGSKVGKNHAFGNPVSSFPRHWSLPWYWPQEKEKETKRKKGKKNPFNAQHNRTTFGWVSTPFPALLHCLADPLNILPLIVLIKVRSLDIGRAGGIGVVQKTR